MKWSLGAAFVAGFLMSWAYDFLHPPTESQLAGGMLAIMGLLVWGSAFWFYRKERRR